MRALINYLVKHEVYNNDYNNAETICAWSNFISKNYINILQILNRLFIIVINSKFLYIRIFKIYIKFLNYNFIYIIDEFVLLRK